MIRNRIVSHEQGKGIMKFKSVLFMMFMLIAQCLATRETVLKVYQPILIEEGVEESISTYVYYIGHPLALHVQLTCAENYIYTQNGVQDRNIAHIYNLKIEVEHNEYGLPTFGDTLRATLILPEDFSQTELKSSLMHEQLITATIACALKNATSFDAVNYLEVSITGESIYQKFSKVYSR